MTSRRSRIGKPLDGLLRDLFGCQWGAAVSTPDDGAECCEAAVQIVVVHDGDWEQAFKLCAAHRDRILRETTPRTVAG